MSTPADSTNSPTPSVTERLVKVLVSIVVIVPVSVFLGYGGWIVLTVAAVVGVYDPRTENGESLLERLVAWPDRNRDVMRTNGRADLPLKP